VWHVTVYCFNIKTLQKTTAQTFNIRTKQNFVKQMHYNSVAFIFYRVSGSSNRRRDFLCCPTRHFQCIWNHPIERRISEIPDRRPYIQKCRSKVSLDSYAETIKIVDSWDFRDIPHSETRDFLSMVFAAVRGLKSGYVLIKMISN